MRSQADPKAKCQGRWSLWKESWLYVYQKQPHGLALLRRAVHSSDPLNQESRDPFLYDKRRKCTAPVSFLDPLCQPCLQLLGLGSMCSTTALRPGVVFALDSRWQDTCQHKGSKMQQGIPQVLLLIRALRNYSCDLARLVMDLTPDL